MIAPMRKVTVISQASERTATVRELRELGLLHVVHRPSEDPHPESAATVSRRDAVRHALGILRALHPLHQHVKLPTLSPPTGVEDLVGRIGELHTRQTILEEHLEDLRFEREELLPLGDFDPGQIRTLAGHGLETFLFRVPANKPFPSSSGISPLGASGGFRFGVAFAERPAAEGLEPVPVPQRSLSEVEILLREAEEECGRICTELHVLEAHAPALEEQARVLEEHHAFQLVGESLARHETVIHLDGFCPLAKVELLRQAARENGWALWIREPEAGENVPVSLDLPRWIRPVQILFKGLGILPAYHEADVSAVFLLFFSLFFAMLIGDAGYGILMLAAVLTARRRKPHASPRPFWLFGVFASATIVWGTLTGNYFGIAPSHLPVVLRGIPWLTGPESQNRIMELCFWIGGAHLSIAHLWNAAVLFPSRKALAQLGWIGVVWLMFFVAAHLVVGRPMPTMAPWMGGAGVLLIVLFMTEPKDFKKEWILHPMLVLNLISCLVDVISYIRLFAVGMASAQIAMNFNQMAAGLPLPFWLKPLGMVLILVLGHGLNLVLGALAILVHAVRLNTLEFSNHKGLTWSGQPYVPFRKHTVPFNA